ncbi:hypothetical protein VTN49DRAFT_102 [Thermomyces lanuginosus]|uniref:uncharacterized protein n=1 Tax=Thermomyces lanuginosus TaxID=5541 RepID=UPI0037429CE6
MDKLGPSPGDFQSLRVRMYTDVLAAFLRTRVDHNVKMSYLRHEHLGPVFCVSCSHGQEPAAPLPQEHLAWAAQTQPSPETPQQVEGRVMVA